MIEKPILKIGDTIKAEFENFLGQMIVVTGVVRRIDSSSTIVGNDITDGVSFFVSIDEILEINHESILSGSVLNSLKEVS
ncbi:hypothetical protein [Acinetobacter kyonggiensis]|uniref:Uncharacterized protein n=1 Tax=Acinetobacter kyonggiensis TaxID=595670 RepID=A0A1H3L6E6_9GAMM|nr:hypothetical protein [Acinetobacter kyonggiensis]SDY59779.1 hypothetical protein SAMN05421643_11614 [Acinetobacter kyonggiensis]